MVRLYRPRFRLEQMICQIVTTIYGQGTTPVVDVITTTVIGDARFNTIIMASQQEANRVLRRGVDRSVRNVLTNIRFGGGQYAGDRACLVVPVAGRKAGYLQFTDRLTDVELAALEARYDRAGQGMLTARDWVARMRADIQANQAQTLRDVYGVIALNL